MRGEINMPAAKVIAFPLDACGGLIDSPNGTITSPSFPDLYPSNKHCIWEIFAPPQYRITLNFTHFDLEGNNVSATPPPAIVDREHNTQAPRKTLLWVVLITAQSLQKVCKRMSVLPCAGYVCTALGADGFQMMVKLQFSRHRPSRLQNSCLI